MTVSSTALGGTRGLFYLGAAPAVKSNPSFVSDTRQDKAADSTDNKDITVFLFIKSYMARAVFVLGVLSVGL